MFTVQLTSYGQTLVSSLVNIDGIILLYDTIADISSVTSTSSYTVQLDEEACGNLNKNIGNVKVQDSRSNEYIAKTILFYVLNGSEKKIVAGYSQDAALVQKGSSPLTVFLSFDFSVFINGFLFSSIQAGYGNAAHNTDGIVHIENPDIESDDNYSVYNKLQTDALLQDKQDSLTAGEGIAITDDTVKTTGIPFGICDNTSTATAFTVTVPGIYKLEDGVCCLVKNGVITSASGFTLNVNGLGGKPVYSNMAAATRETTIFNVNYTMLFVYDSTRVDGGCWVCYRGYYSDANSIAYQIRGNVHTLPTTAKFYRYRLLFTSADGTHFVPSNTSTSTNATALRDVNQTPIDPFGEIVYYSTTAAVDANANPGPTYLWTQYAVTLGYSFNRTGAALVLDSFKPLYIKCAPQSDGSAIIDATTPYVQTLPSTADGKIYIFLGITSSATSVELLNNHPVYYHDGTAIRIWHGKDSYSKSEIDTIVGEYVPTSRTVNNKPLSSDITLTLDDVADGINRVIPTVNDSTITIKKNSSDTGDSFTTNASSGKTINLGLSTVATSGSYNDLSNTPTIPTVNDAKLTIKKNSSDVGTEFTANASSDVTCNLNLAAVASSGSYSDLSNTPSIPTDTSDLTNGAGFISTETDPTVPSWAKEQSKPTYTLDEVTDGSTRKLSDYVPTSRTVNSKALTTDITLTLDDVADGTNRIIPTVNNATLTINKGGTDDTGSKTFSANASSDVTINLGLHSVASSGSYNDLTNKPTIPTTTSQLTNDSGFITSSDLPTNYVTTDTVQTITALKTFIYGIDLGTYHTSASQSLSTQLTVWDDTTNYQGGIEVTGNFNPATEDEYNLGSSNFPWLNVYANSFIKSGGTSAQFLKADGSVDSNTYLTSSDLPINHVTTDTAQEITGTKTIAENKLKIGSTSSNEDIDNFVFKRGQEFIVGTQSSSTSLWKGNTIQDSVYEGMCINYFVPVACTSTAVTLELTLPDGTTTGAIPVRRNAGNTATNTHIGVGSVVQLTLLLNRTVGTTDYEKVWRMNEWYDSNTNTTGYQLRTNSTVMTVTDTARYYKLYFTSADGEHWVPASVNSTNNATTARAVNQRPINPFGRIVYTSASTSYTSGSNLAATTIWDQYAIALGYSFNVSGGDLTLSTKTPVYVKCAPQSDGSAIMDATNPIVQDLPTSADGKIYIFLGVAYDATHIELVINHPVYYHGGSGIKLWTGSTIPSKTSDLTNDSGFITSASIPTNVSQLNNDANYITTAAIPTNVSSFTNDAGYLTSFTETDPTVPSWAKQSSKPSYNLDEVSDGSIRKLSNYELKTNLKEGAYIDVDETTMTSTSTNLPTSKAVASYISDLNYITSADIPTNHVTTDTAQTISGSKSVTSLVHLVGRHNSATHGGLKFSDSSNSTTFTEIASAASDTVSNQASVFLKFYSNSSYVASIDTTFTDSSSGTHIEVEPSADNICYIGTSTNRLKNVYTHNLGSSTVYTDSAYITDIYTTKSNFIDSTSNFASVIEQSGYNFLVYAGGAAGSIRIGSQSQDGITGSIKLTEYELELDCDSSNTYCILPKTASCANLGSSSNPFDYVYANNIDSTSITAMQATIDTVTGYLNGSADTAYALEETTNIDGISYNGSADVNHYAVCSTGAGTKAKKITVPGFVLAEGARVTVKFTATNSASAPTLTVNDGTTDSEAKPICYRGTSAVTTGNYYKWQANDILDLVYDGTNWIIVGWQTYAYNSTVASYATYVGNGSSGYVAYSNNGSAGSRALLPRADVTTTDWVDLGSTAKRWKTLYLTDGISDGTNTFSLPDKSGTLAVELGTYVVSSSPLGSNLIQSGKDYRQPEPSGSNFTDNPKWRGNDVSIGISQYVDLSENSRISIYVPYTTYIGSIAFLSAQGASTYSAYPLYFRGDTSAHNATVPGGSILRLTFREDAFYNDFYDLADFGVEHEPIVRVGKLPHQLTAENYNGALVGVRADNGKLDKVLAVTKSGTTVTETLTSLHSSSPIYVSFMHECFSAHPRVPFGLILNLDYIYNAGDSPRYENIPFLYIENGSIVSLSSSIQSHVVTSSTGKRYFHVNNAPVYLSYRPIGPNSNVYISIGGPYSGYTGAQGTTLLGFLPSNESEAGLLRLVNCFTPKNYADQALNAYNANFSSTAYMLVQGNSSGGSAGLVCGTELSSYVDIKPGTNKNNALSLGSTTYRWKDIYVNGSSSSYYLEIGNDTSGSTHSTNQPVIRPTTNGVGYLGTSDYHLSTAYINNLYVTSSGTSIASYIESQISSKISGTGVGSICLLNVSITNSSSSVATVSRGSLLNSNSNLSVSTLYIASPHFATNSSATPSSYSNTVGCYYSGSASGTSGAYKLLSSLYVPANTTKRYIVLAIRVS